MTGARPAVAIVTLGCARNEVDSEELAAELAEAGWDLVVDPAAADTVLVNTCGFIDSAKRESIDTIMAAADLPGKVVAVGCLAERYGSELADALPEADAVLGFDAYPQLPTILQELAAGHRPQSHTPRDRRALQPAAPVSRSAAKVVLPGHIGVRRRLDSGPVAPVKLASGCDRRCSFCAIPSFRGAFVSRRPADILTEVAWLAAAGVREVNLVSENSTSFGKDLGDLRLLETLLPELAAVQGIARVRVAYLQPAEMRPDLISVIGGTEGVAPYFDLSFQHASPAVLRRMRRFGGTADFLRLLEQIRAVAPEAGVRSNFIVGFPGESERDVEVLVEFLREARLDAIGVFGYSAEEGTEAAGFADALPDEVVSGRVSRVATAGQDLMDERAEARVGEHVDVLVEEIDGVGRAAFQGPEDASTTLRSREGGYRVGTVIGARVVATEGADLMAEVIR